MNKILHAPIDILLDKSIQVFNITMTATLRDVFHVVLSLPIEGVLAM